MGYLQSLWQLDADPDIAPFYTPYSFVPVNMSMGRDFARRESVMVIPGMDSVVDGNGRNPGPMEKREQPFSFRVVVPDGNLDRTYDLLAAQVAPGYPQRLVYLTDSGTQRFTVGSNPRIQQTTVVANQWGSGGYVDFTVTWRIRPDWRARFSEASDIWGYGDGVWGTGDGVWGSAFAVPLTATTTPFHPDATGVAGSTLPTLPDTGPVITINGPFGGDGGILLTTAILIRDTFGIQHYMTLTVPKVLINQVLVLDCAAQRFTLNGVPFRPTKAGPWQREWFRIDPGVVNSCSAQCIGANPTTGGSLLLDFWRKFA